MAMDGATGAALRNLGYSGRPSGSGSGAGQCASTPTLCHWLLSQLRDASALPQTDSSPGVDQAAVLEEHLQGALQELHCPHPGLTLSPDCAHRHNTLIGFLVSELQAARMLQTRERDKGGGVETEAGGGIKILQRRGDTEGGESDRGREVDKEQNESDGEKGEVEREVQEAGMDREEEREVEKELELLLQALDLEPATQESPPSTLLAAAHKQVVSCLEALPGGALPGPLLRTTPDRRQWSAVQQLSDCLSQEYAIRRRMMIKRFQVTVHSFHWGDRGQAQELSERMDSALAELWPSFQTESSVSLPLLLAAREDRPLTVQATQPATPCAIAKIMMGSVPDRGGRPWEMERPMPSWGGRREGGGRGRPGGGQSGKKRRNKKKE
ncbi:protein FAM98C isoform X2 [Amia ocellicauda]